MLAVGIIGQPLIGEMQERAALHAIEEQMPDIYEGVSKTDNYFLGEYKAVDAAKVEAMPAEMTEQVTATVTEAKQGALANMIVFPLIMLGCYIGLIVYFRGRGGYKPVDLQSDGGH